MDTFFFQRLEGLRTGVVKLSRLTDFQCAGAKQQDFLLYCFLSFVYLFIEMSDNNRTPYFSNFTNSSNKNSVSVGPLAASG